MRLAAPDTVLSAMQTLRGRARIKRTMRSRRAQEYRGQRSTRRGLISSPKWSATCIARRRLGWAESYSERQLYEAALSRMVREARRLERIIDEDAFADEAP